MQLLASDTGDCLKDMTVLVIVFGVCLHIPAGLGAAKNKNGHPLLIHVRSAGPFDLKQFKAREYVPRGSASMTVSSLFTN